MDPAVLITGQYAVNFPGDPYPIHIDATFTPLRPGLILNNSTSVPDEQRKMFNDNGWEIVDAPSQRIIHHQRSAIHLFG